MKKVKRRAVAPKPSRALLAFAKPMLDDVADVKNPELTKKILKVALTLWNATTLDERGQSGAMESVEHLIATMPEHLQKISRAMIRARRDSFSSADYLLQDVDVVQDADGKPQVSVTVVE